MVFGFFKKRKVGVNYVFSEHPELEKIGSQEDYSKYLETIFPESKVKNIVYHQTPKKFEEFNSTLSKTGGIYFSPFNRRATPWDYTKVVMINIQNPFKISKKQNRKFEAYITDLNKLSKKADLTGYDGVIGFSNSFYDKGQLDSEIINVNSDNKNNIEFVPFESSQIHILGSQKDIEGFKKYMEKRKSENKKFLPNSLEGKVISGFFLFFIAIGIFLSTPQLTGNAIGTLTKENFNLLSLVSVFVGFFGFFISRKLFNQ